LLENEVWRTDRTAWHVFEGLLLLADYKTGSWTGGRKALAELLDINESTLRHSLERLQKYNMVTRNVTIKFTEYRICNWHKYQQTETRNVTIKRPLYKEIKNNINKNIKNTPHDNELQAQKKDVRGEYSPALEKMREKWGKKSSNRNGG